VRCLEEIRNKQTKWADYRRNDLQEALEVWAKAQGVNPGHVNPSRLYIHHHNRFRSRLGAATRNPTTPVIIIRLIGLIDRDRV
jgi:hypothetical protein